jgi:protein TonB
MWSLQASLHLPAAALLQRRKSPARNLDNDPVTAGRSTSLGVGHFTVPPDVFVEGPAGAPVSNGDVAESWSTIPTIVVPHGIAAVPRRSPIKARKRTPWHPVPEAQGMVERADRREWFTDRLIVESKQMHLPAACTTSAVVHAVIVILVLLLLAARAARADLTPGTQVRTKVDVSLRMPARMSLVPAAVALLPASRSAERPSLAPHTRPAPRPAQAVETPAAAPLEAPSGVEAEPIRLDDTPRDGAAVTAGVAGATDGVASGVEGGTGSGPSVEAVAAAPEASGPFRVGDGIARPRKIKDVKPIYPQPAMASQAMGTVLIEATIGADGRVHNARVLRSVAALDQAALDAVRQWEYEPSRLNGMAVAVTMVIVVTFSLL